LPLRCPERSCEQPLQIRQLTHAQMQIPARLRDLRATRQVTVEVSTFPVSFAKDGMQRITLIALE